MAKLDTLTLRVRDPEAQKRFYCETLGMTDLGDGRVAYSDAQAAIRFVRSQRPYVPQPSDLYWKIALSVPNIERAAEQLQGRGVPCTPPRQFEDVGYLAKCVDPEGFTIELIDHWFEGARRGDEGDRNLLGGGAHLSLITLRTADIEAVEPDLLGWGMVPLSIQPVVSRGFTLYFYAFTEERPPNPNLEALENRTWVYQRPYSVLEIQHVHDLAAETKPVEDIAGYAGLLVSSANVSIRSDRLMISEG